MIPSILIIEDDITFSTMLKTWLEKKGFKTTATSTCAKAKKLLIIVGMEKVVEFMIQNVDSKKRNTGLEYKLRILKILI